MSDGISQFENFWRRMEFSSGGPYVHPDDEKYLTARDREIMKLNLLPIPVNGNLRSADVVILLLNPGFGDADAEWSNSYEIKLASEWATLHQRDWPTEYPLFDLNPALVDSGGAKYWAGPLGRMKGKLGHLAHALAAQKDHDHDHTHIRKELSNRIAVVQRVAYRSKSFRNLPLLKSSEESFRLAKALITEGEKLVVIPYGIQHWGYANPKQTERLVVYNHGLRSAHIAPTSAGYHAVVERLRRGPRSQVLI